jgi:AcrR family transcriptional regulator
VDQPAPEDLTARARIRNAALRLFAERGIERATIRDIALAAGVSGGLVRHHFGSKEQLRNACDAWALERGRWIDEHALEADDVPQFLAAVHPEALLLTRYLTNSMLDGSPAAATMFDRMVDAAERWLTDHHPEATTTDPRAVAAVYVAMLEGPIILHDQVSRTLGTDILTPEGHLRVLRALLELHALLLPAAYVTQARKALEHLPTQSRS